MPVTVTLNHEGIKKDSQRIAKFKPFVNKYNWERINFPSEKDDWKKFAKKDVIIAVKVLCFKKEKIRPASKRNSSGKKQVIFLMISNGEKQWHFCAVKRLSALLRGITSKKNGNFYRLNFPHSFRTKGKLESHKKALENNNFCNVNMPSDDTEILELNQYQ